MQRVQVADTLRNPFRHHCRFGAATCNMLTEKSNLLSFVDSLGLCADFCKTPTVELCYVTLLCPTVDYVVICVGGWEFILGIGYAISLGKLHLCVFCRIRLGKMFVN